MKMINFISSLKNISNSTMSDAYASGISHVCTLYPDHSSITGFGSYRKELITFSRFLK